MKNGKKTKNELIAELEPVRRKVKKLETLLKKHKHTEQDVTECKRAEELQKESELAKSEILKKLNEAQQIALIGSWEWNLQTNKVWWSDETYLIFGVAPQDFVPGFETNGKFIHPDDLENYGKSFDHSLKTGDYLNEIFRLITPNRELKYINGKGKVIFDNVGQPVRFIGTVMDITESKRKEKEFTSAKSLLDAVIDSSPFAMWISDREGMLIRTNRSLRETLNLTDEQLIGKYNVLNDVNLEMQGVMPMVRAVFEINTPARFIIPWKASNAGDVDFKGGRDLYIDVSMFPILENNGELTNVVCQWVDITERKQAEEALRESEERITKAFRSIPEALVISRLEDGKIIEVNDSWHKIFGYSREEVIGKSSLALNLFVDSADRQRTIALLREQGFVRDFEIQVRQKSDALRTAILSVELQESHGDQYLISVVQDITERKRSEEALRESETRYRSVLQSATDAIFTVDGSGMIIGWNSAAERIFGYSYTEAVGQPLTSIVLLYPLDEHTNGMKGLQSEGVQNVIGKTVEFKGFRKDKSVFPIELSLSSWETKSGQYFTSIIRDITERKHAEKTLKESEEQFRVIFEQAAVGMAQVAPDGKWLRFNQRLCDIIGYTREELLTMSFQDIIQPDDIGNDIANLQRLLADEIQTYSSEKRYIRKDGSSVWVNLTISLVREPTGTPKYFVSIIEDITERRQAEEELKKSEEKYRFIFENVQDVYYETLFDGTILEVSPSIEFISKGQYRRADLIGKSMNDFYPDVKIRDAFISAMQKTGSVTDFEVRLKNRDGSFITCSISSKIKLDAQGRPDKIIGSMHDITERKQAEEALQDSELRFRSLYENTTIGLYRTTPGGNILLANPALVKMLGYTSFEKLAERNLEKDGFESSSQRKEFLEKIERDGEVTGYESKWIRQDGRVIFVLESARSIRDSQGKTMYYDGTLENITERKLLEDQMRQMQKLEGLGTLAGGIAHDFNNILGIILAYITSTKRFKDDAKNLDLAVNTIVKAVERGKTLVQQILMFARKTETAFGAVNVNDVVMEIMTMIMETFPKTLTYTQNFDKSVTFINADRSQLHQVLMNLCVNTRDAMPKGGVLTINTRMVSVISLRHRHPDAVASSYVCIEVSDTGEGMTEETQKRIFEPFFTTKEQGKGTGLGLAVVFGVVQTHKGFIDVESELGKGTTFSIYLPASQAAWPIIEKEEETLEEIQGGTETLLVVEDEEMLMMSLQMVLVEKGYKVISAGDGLAAVNIYKERKKEIALVLTDLGLPKMNGKEECAEIKKLNPSARMIVATGYLDPEMKSEFLKAGIQHFLLKPYDLKQVLKVIREVLDKN